MPRQYFRGLLQDPQPAAYPTITATTETVLLPTLFTAIPAGSISPGSTYKLTVGGTCTTGTAGTLILTPRVGTTISGVSLGASPTQNYVPSITLAPFVLEYWLTFPTIGQAGTNGSAIGCGKWISGGAVATAASETAVVVGGVAAVAVDTTIAQALWMGVTFSVAPSVIPRFAIWESV